MINKEKVRELLFRLLSVNAAMDDKVIEEWLEQNQPEPVVVGLSDEQLRSLFGYFPYKATLDEFIEGYQEWAKNQAFAQPENLIVSNSTQLKPNWGDAPDNAAYFKVVTNLCDENHQVLRSHLISEEQRPTPPAPKVEVGQVWGNEFGTSEIIAVNNKQVVRQSSSGDFWIHSLEDFLAKFERVE